MAYYKVETYSWIIPKYFRNSLSIDVHLLLDTRSDRQGFLKNLNYSSYTNGLMLDREVH